MTISTTSSVQSYNGDGVSVAFAIPFYFLANTHLLVTLTDLSTLAVTNLALGPDYSVFGAGVPGGGTLTMVSAPASGKQLTIRRFVPLTQLVDYVPNDGFPADVTEQALDLITMALQQLQDEVTGAGGVSGSGAVSLANIGAGHGVFAQLVGSTAQLKSLIAGTNITLTEDASSITIAGPASSGEANTMSNLGAGSQIFKQKVGVDLQVRSLVAGANITLTQNANDITIAGTGEANSAVNIGVAGTGIFTSKSGVNIQLKGLAGGLGINVTNNGTDITHAINQAASLVWTGQEKFLSGADVADHAASVVTGQAVRIARTAPSPGALAVQAALVVNSKAPAGAVSFEWNQLNYLENRSNSGENVALYTKGYQYAQGATWGLVVEGQNLSGADPVQSLYGIELDICSPGLDPNNCINGMAIFYGDAYPNTFTASGPGINPTKATNGILIYPFQGFTRCGLKNAYHYYGNVDHGFRADAFTGLDALSAAGTYTNAVLDLSGTTLSPVALDMAPGSRLKFRSGTSGGAATNLWFFGAFVPTWFGALAILVDGTTCYIPVCSNHP